MHAEFWWVNFSYFLFKIDNVVALNYRHFSHPYFSNSVLEGKQVRLEGLLKEEQITFW